MGIKQLMGVALAITMVVVAVTPTISAADSSIVNSVTDAQEIGPVVSIIIDIDHIDFGQLHPGETSDAHSVTATNTGLQTVNLTVGVQDEGDESIFVPGITVNGEAWSEYSARLVSDDSDSFDVALHVPDTVVTRGDVGGSMILFAQAIDEADTPVADFSATPLSGDAPLSVQFTDLSTNAPTSWSWDFGDDSTSTVQDPEHSYESAGTYTVSLTASNSAGSDTETKETYITVNEAIPTPKAEFSADVVSGDVPLTVHFIDQSVEATSWAWDFDNNGVVDSEVEDPTYTYEAVGTYDVKLTIDGPLGSDDTVKSEYIVVNAIGVTWELFQGNQQLNGHYAGDAPDTNALKWVSEDIDCAPSSSMVIAEGKIFVYCYDNVAKKNYIAALDLTGTVLWKKECLTSNNTGSWATPAYHDGLVFTSGDVARHAADGSPAWSDGHCLPYNTNGGPMIAEGKVIIGNWDGGKYISYDEKTGVQVWEFTAGGHAQGTPSYHDGKLFLTCWGYGTSSYLYCVDAGTGDQIWSASSGDGQQGFSGSANVVNGFVYVTSYNFYTATGNLYCFYESNGTKAWEQPIGTTDSTPVVYHGKVFVTGGFAAKGPHHTYCFNATTGTLIWSTTDAMDIGGWTFSVVVADGKVFVGLEDASGENMGYGSAMLFALDARDGTLLWQADNGGATVAIHDGVLYTAGADGKIYAYGPTDT
jgi:PKD repeat protein